MGSAISFVLVFSLIAKYQVSMIDNFPTMVSSRNERALVVLNIRIGQILLL